MTRTEFIRKLGDKCPDLSIKEADRGVKAIVDELIKAFDEGKRVEVRKFGCFTTRYSTSRAGTNPRTGEPIHFDSHKVVHFKCGSTFHDLVNNIDNRACQDILDGEDNA